MLHYSFDDSTTYGLQERLQQVFTCKMVRGMTIVNIGILFLIPILDMILFNMSYKVGLLALIFFVLYLFVCLILLISGRWNKRKKCMQLSPIISVLVMGLSVACLVGFYQNVFVGTSAMIAYLPPVSISLIILVIAIVTMILDRRYK
jgi:hypothetical protein